MEIDPVSKVQRVSPVFTVLACLLHSCVHNTKMKMLLLLIPVEAMNPCHVLKIVSMHQ